MKTMLKTAMIIVLCLAMLLCACGSGSSTPAQTVPGESKETLPGKEDATKGETAEESETDMPETTAAPETTVPEDTEPETVPAYDADLSPEVLCERLKVWDETLNQYTGFLSGKKVLLKEESFRGADAAPNGLTCYAYDVLGNERVNAYYDKAGELYGFTVSEYDANGYKISSTSYKSDGTLRDKLVYTNDPRGFVIKEEIYNPGETECTSWDEYELDANGNQIKRLGYRKSVLDFTYEYEYNDAGKNTQTRRFDPDGKLTYHAELVYDPTGHRIAQNSYDPETDTISQTIEFTWSDDYHTQKYTTYDSKGSFYADNISKYDDEGNILSSEALEQDGTLKVRYVYTYSE